MMAETQIGAAYLSCLDAASTNACRPPTTTNFCHRSLAWLLAGSGRFGGVGASDTIRTCGLYLRRGALYPADGCISCLRVFLASVKRRTTLSQAFEFPTPLTVFFAPTGLTHAFGGQRSGAQTISWSRRMYARRLSQAAKRNALQRRCEIDPLSGTSCTSVDDYRMSLPRVELDNINQPDDRRLKPARLP
jgi:hypothetical protein